MRISDWSSDVCSSDLPRNIALDARGPDFLQPLHLVDDRQRMLLERHRIVATDDEGDVPARKTARLALERHARVGDGGQLRLHAAFPLDARHIAMFLQGQKGVPAPDARSEEHTSELQSLMRISYAVFCL